MDRSGEYRKGAIALIMVLSMIISSMLLIGEGPKAQAKASDEKDDFGYFWMDNKDPDPKVEYSWIPVRDIGTELEIYSSDGYEIITLPWSFPYYGLNYDNLYVGSRGLIWFEDIYYAPSGYSSYPVPDTSPTIAACWGYPYNDYTSYGGVHYLTGIDSIGKYVCIEWNSNYYSQTYELILWETGLIKMQFNNMGTTSGYSDGNYMMVGLQNEDSSITNMYTTYGVTGLNNGLAIEYAFGTVTFDNFKITNGGGPENHTAFAELDLYSFSFDVMDSEGFSDISTIRLYFGPPSLGIYVKYVITGGLPVWSVGGGGQYLDFNATRSLSDTQVLPNLTGIKARVYVKFMFDIPLNGNISVTLWARGGTALPNAEEVQDAFYLDTQVDLVGKVIVYDSRGYPIKNEGFTKELENISFNGTTLVYDSCHTVYPPDSSFYFHLVDDELNEYVDRNASGREMLIWLLMPSISVRKSFTMDLRYGNGDPFPAGKFIGEFPSYAFRIDDSSPTSPATLTIRADSFKDTQREYDNDNVLFISWSSVIDSGSGVSKYRVWTTYAPGDLKIPYVDGKVTQYIWNGTTEGVFRVFVWAEDAVGHAGDWKEASIIIDKKDIFFSEFSPDPRDTPWLRTLTPDISIEVKDNLTISNAATGVRPSTIEYSVSTSGIENFEEWISADLYDEEIVNPIDAIDVKLKPRFIETTENYIRFRAKDYAGNGYAYSETYNLKIDVTPVEVREFFPTPNVWHDLNVISNRDIECYLFDDTSGIRTSMIYYRIGTAYDAATSTYTWATGIPQQQGWEKLLARDWERIEGNELIHITIPYSGYQEGDQNFIQLMFRDEAGNGDYDSYFGEKMSVSPLYQIYVNTQPVAVITSPVPLQEFWITDHVTLDASGSYDIDVDEGNLKFQWFCRELNKTLGYDMVQENLIFPAEGWYNITLYVGDSVHRYDPVSGVDTRSVVNVRMRMKVFKIDPKQDMEPDGMPDIWEQEYFLTIGYDDSDEDADGDGWTNLKEYKAGTDPQDSASKPDASIIPASGHIDEAPFGWWLFIAIVAAAIIIGAVVVLLGYLRIQRVEEKEQTEEAEEEAMLATPQLDIPAMPQIPMVDGSIPTLPAAEQPQTEALPPAPHAEPPMVPAPMEGYQEPPMPEPVSVQEGPAGPGPGM
ncbi:MAG: hypothetical protein JXA22_07530 [Candidatus Thermoplasmatota archaeon]|nr:hypothetical protein [Candidatus Thermoplasmatota archaeon]